MIIWRGIDRNFRSLPSTRHLRKLLEEPGLAVRNIRFNLHSGISYRRHIFVVGPPRSGTTLVSRLLKAHSKIGGLDSEGMPIFFRWNVTEFRVDGISDSTMKRLIAMTRDKVQLFDSIADYVCQEQMVERFLDKTPENALKMTFLRDKFPRSHIIFVTRDGRDGYISAQSQLSFSSRDLSKYANLWKYCVKMRMREINANNIIDVKYEDLCVNPDKQLSRVMGFLGEELQERQLEVGTYGQTKLKDKPGHNRLGETISDRSVGRWRTEASYGDIQKFHRIAGRELEIMGYSM